MTNTKSNRREIQETLDRLEDLIRDSGSHLSNFEFIAISTRMHQIMIDLLNG